MVLHTPNIIEIAHVQEETRPNTWHDSHGRLGRIRNAKTARNSKKVRDRKTDQPINLDLLWLNGMKYSLENLQLQHGDNIVDADVVPR